MSSKVLENLFLTWVRICLLSVCDLFCLFVQSEIVRNRKSWDLNRLPECPYSLAIQAKSLKGHTPWSEFRDFGNSYSNFPVMCFSLIEIVVCSFCLCFCGSVQNVCVVLQKQTLLPPPPTLPSSSPWCLCFWQSWLCSAAGGWWKVSSSVFGFASRVGMCLCRNKDRLFPRIPQPRDLISGISNSPFKVIFKGKKAIFFFICMNWLLIQYLIGLSWSSGRITENQAYEKN